jgi:hypothetical protein
LKYLLRDTEGFNRLMIHSASTVVSEYKKVSNYEVNPVVSGSGNDFTASLNSDTSTKTQGLESN